MTGPEVPDRRRPTRIRRAALSLIEVVASLVILGSAVTTLLAAYARNMANVKEAERQLVAHEIARELIAQWRVDEVDLTVSAQGAASNAAGWSWRRWAEPISLADAANLRQITVEVRHQVHVDRDFLWNRRYSWLVRDNSADDESK